MAESTVSKKGSKALILVVLIAVCVIGVVVFDIQEYLIKLVGWIEGLGLAGRVIYIAIYAIATVLFVPGSILTLGAGTLFGWSEGVIVVLIGATLGALGAFITGRYFLKDWVHGLVTRFPRFQSVYDAIGKEGGKIIFFLRLSPLFPFNASNYIYSLTSVKFGAYIWATLLGIMPGTILYVYFGTLLGSIAKAASGTSQGGPLRWVFLGVGLVATVFVTIYAARVARKALEKSAVE